VIKKAFPSIISGATLSFLEIVVDLSYGATRLIKYVRRAFHRPFAYWLQTARFYLQSKK
jgi:hypothetical protein